MGRAKKTQGAPTFLSYGASLSKEDEDRLLDLLGIDPDDPEDVDVGLILSDIAIFLGAYPGLLQATDNAPRPANYIFEIGDPSDKNAPKTGLVYDANNLLQILCNTSQWVSDAYTAAGYDIHDIERELGRFIDASCKVIQGMKKTKKESRGAPKKEALKSIINHLNWVFDKYYQTEDIDEDSLDDDDHKDNRKVSGKEQSRTNFIEECLKLANIACPKNWRNLLWKETDSPESKIVLKQF